MRHSSNSWEIFTWFKSVPIITNCVWRSPYSISQSSATSCREFNIACCWLSFTVATQYVTEWILQDKPAYDNRHATSLYCANHTIPFVLTIFWGKRSNHWWNLFAWKGNLLVYAKDEIPYSSVSGVCVAWPPSVNSLIHPADSLAFSKSNNAC